MTIEELCRRSYDTAVAKGWHEEPRSLGEAIALFHSEVSEALECWRDPIHKLDEIWHVDGKPEGFVIELADLLIRIADTAEDMKLHFSCTPISMLGEGYEKFRIRSNGSVMTAIPEMLSLLHSCLSKAFDCACLGNSAFYLEDTMRVVGAICRHHGLDLEKALLLKMDYNDLRPHRHGGTRA